MQRLKNERRSDAHRPAGSLRSFLEPAEPRLVYFLTNLGTRRDVPLHTKSCEKPSSRVCWMQHISNSGMKTMRDSSCGISSQPGRKP